jgi:hypothetical protein
VIAICLQMNTVQGVGSERRPGALPAEIGRVDLGLTAKIRSSVLMSDYPAEDLLFSQSFTTSIFLSITSSVKRSDRATTSISKFLIWRLRNGRQQSWNHSLTNISVAATDEVPAPDAAWGAGEVFLRLTVPLGRTIC